MKSVKEVLKQKKLPEGYPPTMEDVETRERHVPDSVRYNMQHFKDHGKNATDNLGKLKQVNPPLAKRQAREALKAVEGVANNLKEFIHG